MARVPEIELLWCSGCPSTESALGLLREALEELELGSAEVRVVEIRTDEEAQASGFTGSPTILIDGRDLITRVRDQEAPEVVDCRLCCRVYRRRDGRISPTPDPRDIRDALALAIGSSQTPGTSA